MNQELIDRLKEMGLDENQIQKLGPLGVTEEVDLAYLKEEDLTSLGVAPIKARRIIAEAKQAGQSKTEEPSGLMPELAGALKNLASAIARKPVTEWSIADLIAGLIAEPDNDQLTEELESRLDYTRARIRSKAVIARKDGTVNPLVSQKYIRGVAKGGPVLDQFEGHQMVSPELAFGQKVSKWRHPLIVNWVITNGVDEAGLMWENKDLPRIRMAIWARDIRRHPLFPANPDPVNEHSALTSETLSGRWSQMWQAYQLWLEEGNEEPNVNVREGQSSSMPPFGDPATGGNQTPIDWPSRLEHTQLISLIEAMAAFSKEELIEVARESGVDHENLPYSNLSGLRRELVQYHQRRTSVARLMTALTKHRPQTGWAQVIGLMPQKAGHGDSVFIMSGDFRDANLNIGNNK